MTNYKVKEVSKLTKKACAAKVSAFRKFADKATGEKRRKALKMAAWYKHRAKAA